MRNLPTELVRGDTYYLADGEYGKYTFDTPNSGTSTITIKEGAELRLRAIVGWLLQRHLCRLECRHDGLRASRVG